MLQEFVEEIYKAARSVRNEMHTAVPGTIVSFDYKKGLAVVQPIGKYATEDGKKLSYPKISDVPVVFPYSFKNDIGIVFPVEEGDSCLLVFSENELDEWLHSKISEITLKYDLTSAIAIPGIINTSTDTIKQSCGNKAVIIKAKDAYIKVSEQGIEINACGSNTKIDEDTMSMEVNGVTLGFSDGKVSISGDVEITGNVVCTGNVEIDGIDFGTHVHRAGSYDTSEPKNGA